VKAKGPGNADKISAEKEAKEKNSI